MKTKGKGAVLASVLTLLIFLSPSPLLLSSASAHDGDHDEQSVTAAKVNITNMESVKSFVEHAKAHFEDVETISDFLDFRSKMTTDGSDWKENFVYLVRTDEQGAVYQHPHYPLAQSGILNEFEDDNGEKVVQRLLEKVNQDGETGCVSYTWDNPQDDADQNPKWVCAAKFDHPLVPGLRNIFIGGLHHNFSDVSFAKAKCPSYDPADPEVTKVTAVDVVDKDTLKQFVDQFAEYYVRQRERIGVAGIAGIPNCWRILPWKYDSVYLFIMNSENKYVAFNGNNPELENTTLEVTDANGADVAQMIIDEVNDPDGDGFVEYLWDDPTTEDDNVDLNECPDGPGTCAPGTSPKISYVKFVDSSQSGQPFIFGSGIYPKEMEEGDGGCAIAGSHDTPLTAMLSLFLIVALLFSTVAFGRNRLKEWVARKGRWLGAVSVMTLLVFLSGTSSASAHGESVTAANVDITNMESVRAFVEHAKADWESADDPNASIRFERSLSEDGGDWKKGDIYLMVIDEKGVIFTQPHYPLAQNGALIEYSEGEGRQISMPIADVGMLIDAVNEGPEAGCVQYALDGELRWSCAVRFSHPVWSSPSDEGSELILIGGFHHDFEDVVFEEIGCPVFAETIDDRPFFRQGLSANEVVDENTLKQFVGEFIKHFEEQVEIAGQSLADLAKTRNCWRMLPWKYGAVYTFIMTEDEQLVFFNGNSPALENGTFDVKDANGCDVGDEVVRVVNGQDRECKSLGLLPEDSEGFVEYLWDDPTDNIDPVIEEGRAPGDVPKLSYVESVNFLGKDFIIGSGIYFEDSGDDGCAVAGAAGTTENTVFNLLLIMSALLPAILWKKRTG